MLKKLILENWKSFRYAELYFDPLTVLIGANASGKSNAIEALDFLSRISRGEGIHSALSTIRGGLEWVTPKSDTEFTLQVLIAGEEVNKDYLYKITLETQPTVKNSGESLIEITKDANGQLYNQVCLFNAKVSNSDPSKLSIEVASEEDRKRLSDIEVERYWPIPVLDLLGLGLPISLKEKSAVQIVSRVLKNTFILNPIPSSMRNFSPLAEELKSNASNIASVLATLPIEDKSRVEAKLSAYAALLPEREIRRVWAEPVGILEKDTMLYCEESWSEGQESMLIDARSMSDGTLRFLGILTALLTRPEGSQLVIEEVDNGLHPSRAGLLLRMLKEIGAERKIDVLVTTHNPALLNALEPDMISFVTVAHRNSQTGESQLTLLEDLDNLPKLLASGSLGDLAERGAIERSLTNGK